MAGTYVDVPDYQMPLHLDGTKLLWRAPNAVDNAYRDVTDQLVFTQDNGPESYSFPNGLELNTEHEFTLVFPEPRDVTNYYIGVDRSAHNGAAYTPTGQIQASLDTTDGTDGTWADAVALADTNASAESHRASSRTAINTFTMPSGGPVTGIRFTYLRDANEGFTNIEFHCIHFYGTYPAGSNDKRLAFWDATLDQAVGAAHFDFGDIWSNGSKTKTFRIKNLSTASAASGVVLSASSISDAMADTIEFTDSGGVWVNELTVGDIPADTITTETYSVRRTVQANSVHRLQTATIQAIPDSWS